MTASRLIGWSRTQKSSHRLVGLAVALGSGRFAGTMSWERTTSWRAVAEGVVATRLKPGTDVSSMARVGAAVAEPAFRLGLDPMKAPLEQLVGLARPGRPGMLPESD